LGCDAGFLGVVGSDQWGERLLKNFEEEGVDTSCVTVVEGETSSFSIILSVSSGERIILYEPGTNSHLADATFDRSAAASVEWIYLNHIDEKSCMIEDDLVNILEESGGPGLTWNPGGSQLESGMREAQNAKLLSCTGFLVLNKEEALQFTKAKTVTDAFRAFAEAGATIACITDGKRGSMAYDGRQLVHCGILDAPVIDTTGAGDAFGAGATWAILAGLDLPEMLRAGTMNATSVLGVIGAEPGLLTDTEMRSRLQSVPLECEVTSLDRCPW
ncbi:carbohydrate kinase family protein, partial [Candidatus Peregrinibacteria bacterium]|nr:carbohydrate kinase family protein [Candidatus Peregrinibacteria bacterium]